MCASCSRTVLLSQEKYLMKWRRLHGVDSYGHCFGGTVLSFLYISESVAACVNFKKSFLKKQSECSIDAEHCTLFV
jgi:hypothetical protein